MIIKLYASEPKAVKGGYSRRKPSDVKDGVIDTVSALLRHQPVYEHITRSIPFSDEVEVYVGLMCTEDMDDLAKFFGLLKMHISNGDLVELAKLHNDHSELIQSLKSSIFVSKTTIELGISNDVRREFSNL